MLLGFDSVSGCVVDTEIVNLRIVICMSDDFWTNSGLILNSHVSPNHFLERTRGI